MTKTMMSRWAQSHRRLAATLAAGAVSEGSAGHSSTAVELRSAKLWVSGGGGSVGVVKGREEHA